MVEKENRKTGISTFPTDYNNRDPKGWLSKREIEKIKETSLKGCLRKS